jgi:GTPase SAR1 family protein
VLVYDVTDRQSFDCIARWMGDIAEQGKQDCDVILCGNKCDMKERAVTTAEGEKLAKQYKVRSCYCHCCLL